MLALWSRARPRDYFDVDVLLEHYGRGELLELAACDSSSAICVHNSPTHRDRPADGSDGYRSLVGVVAVREDANP